MSLRRAEERVQRLFAMQELQHQRQSPPIDVEAASGLEPPRLSKPHACGRAIFVCVICFLSVLFVCLTAMMLGWVYYHVHIGGGRAPHARPIVTPLRPVPTILKKVLRLKRAPAPGHGVDAASLQEVFPTWGQPPQWSVDDAVRDLALALLHLAERLPDPNAKSATLNSAVEPPLEL
jgi:hypothetical protein